MLSLFLKAVSLSFILSLAACASTQPYSIQDPKLLAAIKAASPEQLASLVYKQAYTKYDGKYSDKCTLQKIDLSGEKVIFNSFLDDKLCDDRMRNSSEIQVLLRMQELKTFRVNEIKKVPSAIMMLDGGVKQVYRYYILPEKKLMGEFVIDKSDVY